MTTILKFSERVNKEFPQISVDALVSIYLDMVETEEKFESTELIPEKKAEAVEVVPEEKANDNPTCKHKYLKGKNANKQCTTKVKGGGDYCSKHKNFPHK